MQNGVPGMIGETAFVTKEITDVHHPGLVRARGEEWMAIPLDPDQEVPIGVGTDVVVADVQGGLLVVYATGT
jgi:membrane protein implicated in regulation of membrane protease activity